MHKTLLRGKPAPFVLELSIYYKEKASFIRQMLQHFIRKGQLQACILTPKCVAQCTDCDPVSTTVFGWCVN